MCALQKLVEVERSSEWIETNGQSSSSDAEFHLTKVFNVGIFETGDFFGEEDFFLSGASRQSHCAALTDADVLEIHFAVFTQFVPKHVRDVLRRISLSRNTWRNARTGALIKSLQRRHWILSSGQRSVFDQDMQQAFSLAEQVSSGLVQTEMFVDKKVVERVSAMEIKPMGILFKVSQIQSLRKCFTHSAQGSYTLMDKVDNTLLNAAGTPDDAESSFRFDRATALSLTSLDAGSKERRPSQKRKDVLSPLALAMNDMMAAAMNGKT